MKSLAHKVVMIAPPRCAARYATAAAAGGGGGGGGGGGVTPLSALTIYDVEAAGFDFSSNPTQTITGSASGVNVGDGIVRAQTFANILGTGQRGHIKRVRVNDAPNFSGRRSEFSWSGQQPQIPLNQDVWFSIGCRPLSGEWHGDNNAFSDQQAFFQIHQQNAAGDGPTFALKTNGGDNSMRCEGNYDLGLGGGGSNGRDMYNCGQDSNLLVDTWNVLIIHLRFAITIGNAPRVEVWRRNGGGAFAKVIDLSGAAAYMGYGGDTNYPKFGIYKWTSTTQDNDTRALYFSDLFYGAGTNLYNEAAESVKNLV